MTVRQATTVSFKDKVRSALWATIAQRAQVWTGWPAHGARTVTQKACMSGTSVYLALLASTVTANISIHHQVMRKTYDYCVGNDHIIRDKKGQLICYLELIF